MWDSLGENASSDIRTVGDVVTKYEDHRQISAGAAKGAETVNGLNNQWEDIKKNADPNDPAVAANFRDNVLAPALDKFKEGFTTENSQAWAEQFTDRYRQHMFEKSAADMSTLAGIAVKQNFETAKNQWSSAVANDPSLLPTALAAIDHSVGAMASSSPNLSAETAAKVSTELRQDAKEAAVKSAVIGMIQKNPNVDLDAVQKQYGDYINGGEMKQFQKAAQVQAKTNALVEKQTQVAQRQLDEQKVHAGATKVLSDNVTFDPQTGKPIVDPKFFSQALDIARKNPDAPNAASTVQTMFNWGEGQQNKGAKPEDDPVVKSDLMTRMFSADKPTTVLDLMKARAEGKISDHSFEAMHGLVQELEQTPLKGPVWHDTIEAAKSELVLSNVGMPGKDITGEGNYAKWAQTFIPQYLAKSRDGTLPPNALDVKDPTSLISQSMAPFKRSVQQRAQDYLSVLSGGDGSAAAPTRKVGDVPVPAALGGIASLQYNKAKGLWRDQASGKIYDAKGAEVAQ